MSTSKRRDLSFSEKMDILRSYDRLSSTKMSQRNAAIELNISQPLLNKLLKQRKDIESASLTNENQNRKRKRTGKDEDVECALKEWFLKAREKDCRLNGLLLRQKAEELAKIMGKTDFVATEGWFYRWKKRENICFKQLPGEQAEADEEAHSWLQPNWQELLAQYSSADVFSAAETGLYFRALPEQTYALKNYKTKGINTSKERLTLLCCASMAGERKKLLAIGKSKSPRCFKGVKKLPVDYEANSNAWMTNQIFNDWLLAWDKTLTRNILLLIGNCPVHNITKNYNHIQIFFLPSNSTSLNQPCDLGIIRTFKALYRTQVWKTVLSAIEQGLESGTDPLWAHEIAEKINVLEALHLVNKSWAEVSEQTIRNCFRHGGFVQTELEEEVPIEKPSDIDDKKFDEWIEIDSDVQVQTDDEITEAEESICIKILQDKEEEEEDSDDDEEDEPNVIPHPSNREMLDALQVLRRGVQFRAEDFQLQYQYERFILDVIRKSQVQ